MCSNIVRIWVQFACVGMKTKELEIASDAGRAVVLREVAENGEIEKIFQKK